MVRENVSAGFDGGGRSRNSTPTLMEYGTDLTKLTKEVFIIILGICLHIVNLLFAKLRFLQIFINIG